MNHRDRAVLLSALCLSFALCALPAVGATVYAGIDSWITQGNGASFTDFSREPLPAGFFCEGSAPWSGRIVWRGVPIVMASNEQLAPVDTIVERLDDSSFDFLGRATTRIKVRALSLESVAPVRTSCGSFNARVTLSGNQPVTRMQIFLEGQDGGRYLAPLALNVKLSFTPVGSRGRTLEVVRPFRLGADPRAIWSFNPEAKAARSSKTVQVDTDGDGIPDTELRRSSNFSAGRPGGDDKHVTCTPAWVSCHANDGCAHCVESCAGVCDGVPYDCP